MKSKELKYKLENTILMVNFDDIDRICKIDKRITLVI